MCYHLTIFMLLGHPRTALRKLKTETVSSDSIMHSCCTEFWYKHINDEI